MLQDVAPLHTSLHKTQDVFEPLSFGFRSTATQQSAINRAVPLKHGSIVEVFVMRRQANMLITPDPDRPKE